MRACSVRAAVKAASARRRELEAELPQCALGPLLLQWVGAAKRVGRAAAALRAAQQRLADAAQQGADKERKLTDAREAKVRGA